MIYSIVIAVSVVEVCLLWGFPSGYCFTIPPPLLSYASRFIFHVHLSLCVGYSESYTVVLIWASSWTLVHFDVVPISYRTNALDRYRIHYGAHLWVTETKLYLKKIYITLVCVSLLTNKKMYACYKFFVSFQYKISFFSAFFFLCISINISPMNKNETVLESCGHVEEVSNNIVLFLLGLLRDRFRRA